ncbi:MAG: hypothetical protein ACP5NC_00785 [Nitrososphaeria archaeon]
MADIISSFNFDNSFEEHKNYGTTRVYRHAENEFVIDSEEGRQIASDPSVYGTTFDDANLRLARVAVKFMKDAGLLDGKVVLQHVLRASLGYRIREALYETGKEFREVWTRPVYSYTSYRAHTVDDLTISYDEPAAMPNAGEFYLLKPDTEATGFTSLKILDNFFKKCRLPECRIKTLVLYGFISKIAIDRIRGYLSQRGIPVVSIAIENITPLSENGYDMPLYGIDEQAYSSRGEKNRLAAAVPMQVLRLMLNSYYPGMDQPGDWSDRQKTLYDGRAWTPVDPLVHLNRSLKMLERVRLLNRTEEWYSELHEKIYVKLRERLAEEIQKNSL